MTRATTFITAAIALVSSTEGATGSPVTYDSPCEFHGNHGKARLSVKNDPSHPPTDASAVKSITPSDIFSWPGPGVRLTGQSKRIGIEDKWFALTGRVVALKAELDG